jgi:hypothetical protein
VVCGDIGDTDIPIGSDDPNNLHADDDEMGCESGDNNSDENVGSQHESASEETGSANADSSDSTTNGDVLNNLNDNEGGSFFQPLTEVLDSIL